MKKASVISEKRRWTPLWKSFWIQTIPGTTVAFRSELSRCGMIQSLSGTGHCFDNARMESFFATLKKEKIYQIAAYKLPREQVKTIIFRYIFIYYNRVRVYTRNPLGLPPVKYQEWAQAQTAA